MWPDEAVVAVSACSDVVSVWLRGVLMVWLHGVVVIISINGGVPYRLTDVPRGFARKCGK